MAEPDDRLLIEYQEVNFNIRALTDIRFKLIGFVPIVTAAGVGLIARGFDTGASQPALDDVAAIGLSLFGFVAVFAIVIYDQRNSELYNSLIGRAAFIESTLKLPHDPESDKTTGGQFNERPIRSRLLFEHILLWHDRALSLVYGAALGVWTLPLLLYALDDVDWGWGDYRWLALGATLAVSIFWYGRLSQLDYPGASHYLSKLEQLCKNDGICKKQREAAVTELVSEINQRMPLRSLEGESIFRRLIPLHYLKGEVVRFHPTHLARLCWLRNQCLLKAEDYKRYVETARQRLPDDLSDQIGLVKDLHTKGGISAEQCQSIVDTIAATDRAHRKATLCTAIQALNPPYERPTDPE